MVYDILIYIQKGGWRSERYRRGERRGGSSSYTARPILAVQYYCTRVGNAGRWARAGGGNDGIDSYTKASK